MSWPSSAPCFSFFSTAYTDSTKQDQARKLTFEDLVDKTDIASSLQKSVGLENAFPYITTSSQNGGSMPLPTPTQILWSEIAVVFFLFCGLVRLYEELKTMVGLHFYETRTLRDLRYSYQKSGKKMSPQQTAFVHKMMSKPTWWMDDRQKQILDWYMDQIADTGQSKEIEVIDVPSSAVR